MTQHKVAGLLAGIVLVAGLWAGPAVAEDPGQADKMALWPMASAEELARERGGVTLEADGDLLVSLNLIFADVDNTVSAGGDVTAMGGDITLGAGAISGNTLSITTINSGNNVVLNSSAAVNIYLH